MIAVRRRPKSFFLTAYNGTLKLGRCDIKFVNHSGLSLGQGVPLLLVARGAAVRQGYHL